MARPQDFRGDLCVHRELLAVLCRLDGHHTLLLRLQGLSLSLSLSPSLSLSLSLSLIPSYFNLKVEEESGVVICPKTVGEMLRNMKGSGWGYIFFTGVMAALMAVTMSFLSHLHFFAFKDFCKKDSAEIGTHVATPPRATR